MNPNVAVSIVICTRNRAEKLGPALASLDALGGNHSPSYEIVCVDNNSNDTTSDVIQAFKAKSHVELTYVLEPKAGLAHARNTGVMHLRGEIIAMTDDDCIVVEDWLQVLFEKFESRPLLGVMGGRVELHNPLDLPITIRTYRNEEILRFDNLNFIVGCNMAFRRSAFNKVKGFDNLLGAGAPLKAGEDTDFVYRVHRQGYEALYCPDACVRHDHGRRTTEAALTLITGYTYGQAGFYSKMILRFDKNALRLAYWEITEQMRDLTARGTNKSTQRDKARKKIRTLAAGMMAYPLNRIRRLFP